MQHVEITAVVDTQLPHDSVADFVSLGSRVSGTSVQLLRRGFIDTVGLGFEDGGFPGFLLRLFLIRVAG
jgi:hypothetical protein